MPIREFTDADGVRWMVWSTIPDMIGVPHSMMAGWLTFDSAGSRRRLIPLPEGWEDASVTRLREYCLEAQPVRKTPDSGMWRIDDPEGS